MEKQFEGKTNNPHESKVAAEDILSDDELDAVSGGDESPKEEHTFGHS